MKYSFDSGDFGLLIEDSIKSQICLLLRDSSYMSVTSSDADIDHTAASKEDMNNELDYYCDSNNIFVYQTVSSDINCVYNANTEQDFDEAEIGDEISYLNLYENAEITLWKPC